jgi:hypothetical protein
MTLTAGDLRPRRFGIDGAVDVLDAAPARLEEVGFLDEAALLDRVFEAQRAEARQMRAKARQVQAEVRRTRKRLASQREALRWTLRQIARREALSPRQRQLLVELHEELRRAETLLGPD